MQNLVNQAQCVSITILVVLISVLALFSPGQISANDTSARVGAGGITLLKSENIHMVEEALTISTKKITARYRFLNESDHDIKTTVAFPLPDYEYDPDTVDFKELRAYRKFYTLKIWADGKPVPVTRLQKALVGTTDVTDKLRKIGLTDTQIFETFGESESDGAVLTTTQREKIAELLSNISGGATEYSSWKVSETIYWEQTFPKGKEIEVVHEYTPNKGNAPNYISRVSQKEFMHPIPKAFSLSKNGVRDQKEACVDNNTVRSVQRNIKSILSKYPDSQAGVHLFDVEYILGIGRNWNGPIGSFTLSIIKDSPGQFVSLCFPAKPKQLNSTSIQFSLKNYIPQDKLIVYFITAIKN